MNRRLKSFTIIELVVVMILTAITISIAYVGYALVTKSLANYMSSTEALHEYLLLSKTLERDFDGAVAVKDSLDNTIVLQTEKGGPIVYCFGGKAVVRTVGSSSDSFFIATRKLSFDHQDESSGLVTAISFEAVLRRAAIPLSYVKVYSAQELMKPR